MKLDAQGVNAFRIELLNDPNLPFGGPGRSIQGTGALTEFEVEVAPASDPTKTRKIKFKRAVADIAMPETPLAAIYDDKGKGNRVLGPADFACDAKNETAWGVDAGPGRRNTSREAIFFTDKPIEIAGAAVLTFHIKQDHGGWNSDDNQNHNLGRFRLSVAKGVSEQATPLPQSIRAILAIVPENRTDADRGVLFSFWRNLESEWLEANRAIDKVWSEHPEGVTQLALLERREGRTTHRLERGDFLKPKEAVLPGVPAWLAPFPEGAPGNRLGFARWLVDRKNPTAARSIVNRVWQAHFGAGLVDAAEDLGSQSDPPSHPELLDWLAVEFMDKGWDLKNLHKLIVMTSAYKRSSRTTSEELSRDPGNRFLARGPRFRVDAETVRDIALFASGLLNPRIGGPGVFPPAPEFLFSPPTSYGPKVWKESTGPDRYRRALYTFRFRSVPYPMLQAFDAPNGDFSCVRRVKSNTPLQALDRSQ